MIAEHDDVIASVLNTDIEGVDPEDIIEVGDERTRYEGTLCARSPIVAPTIIECAWRTIE